MEARVASLENGYLGHSHNLFRTYSVTSRNNNITLIAKSNVPSPHHACSAVIYSEESTLLSGFLELCSFKLPFNAFCISGNPFYCKNLI